MIKQERIERYKEALLRREHVAGLIGRFALGLDDFSFRALEGGEDNLNILICDRDGRGVAVARHYLITPADKVSAELELVTFLAERGFPTPVPLRSRDGTGLHVEASGPSIALFPYVAGEHHASWSSEQLRTGGRMLARMHGLCDAQAYRIGRTLDREGILREGMATVAGSALRDKDLFLSEVEGFLRDAFPAGAEALRALPFGPVHHDMNAGNVLWQADAFAALIDFDEAQDAPFITDLVMGFHYLALDESNRLVEGACRDLIDGYRAERGLSEAEIRSLQFCWDYANLTGAMEFITGNLDDLGSTLECRSFSELYRHNRDRLRPLAAR